MTPLNSQQQQLLFDHAFGLTSESDAAEAERLLTTDPEAVHIYNALRNALSPLDALEVGPCPDVLAERTISGLKDKAQSGQGQARLEQLLEAEQVGASRIKIPFWRNWGDIAAVAAVLVLFVGVVLPALGFTRQRYWRQQCQMQLGNVHAGLASYVSEHDGQLPSVPVAPGSPWWKVGYQGAENHSNTRRAWLLVKQGYVEPDRFICPGRQGSRVVDFDTLEVAQYNDFPERAYVHFSIRIGCPDSRQQGLTVRRAIFADLNPIAEKLPTDYSAPFNLRMCQDLLTSNSTNHNRRGQNVLFCDGSVEFTRQRYTSISEDDIYTLSDMADGCEVRGVEVPSCETDAFLAP
jgi:prepilin-type processing-associated H-X9-DG protein